MKKFPLRRDLGMQLLALYGLFVGLVIVAAVAFAFFASRRLQADVRAADLALARAIAQETDVTLDNALEAVQQLGTYPAVVTGDAAGMEALFGTLLQMRRDVNLIYRLDAQGMMRFHYPVGPESTVGVDFSFRDYFQRALNETEPLVSKGRISPTTDQPVATAVMPIWQNGVFLGLVGTNVKLQSLSDSLANVVDEFRPEEELQILIIDAAGQIIAHSDPDLLLQDAAQMMPPVTEATLAGQSGNLIYPETDGQERLYSYVSMPSTGWSVVVSRPTAVAFATPRAFQRGAALAIAVFLLGGLYFWLVLSRRVIRPLERLTAFSRAIGDEDDPAVTHARFLAQLTARPDQMGHLSRSLQRMQQAVEARLNELSTLLNTSTAVVSTLDLQAVLDRILQQVERLLHTQMCAIFALDQQRGVFRVRASRSLPQWYADHAVIDPDEPTSVTMRAIRSGQPVQISDTETNPSFTVHRARARTAGYRSLLAVPLNTQHAPPSALLVFRPDAHQFSNDEINLLASFANHAAMAIENATLFARSDMALQEQTRRLEALIQSMGDGIILENLDGHVLYANRRVSELCAQYGLDLEAAAHPPVQQVMAALTSQADDQEAILDKIETAVSASSNRRVEFAIRSGPDRVQYWRLRLFDVTDKEGTIIGHGRILQDITQRRKLDRMKSSLISTVSHELRTPLAAIKGYATTLLADDVEWDAASQREFLDIISAETDHLSELVSDLLDMSRIEAGNLQVSRTACDLAELIDHAAQRAQPQPGERLQVQLPPDLPPLFVDPQRIEVVLRNLIENAAKYSGAQSPVTVRATQQNGQVLVSVVDEGPGIAAEDEEHIFESFYRVESGLTRQTAGAGLGLAISRGFVRAHGGDIWLNATEQGACVSFSLPLDEAE